ncbi:MAG: BsuPI-related putative proteinase inhibitor [bacterium]
MLFSITLLITVCFFACDFPAILNGDNQPLNSNQNKIAENLLFVEITGGIAGVNQRLVVDEFGLAIFVDSFYPGAKWVAQLSPAELDSLITLFLDNNFFQLNEEYLDEQVADAFFYAISFKHNNMTKTVRTDYFGAPDNLKSIVDGVLQLKNRIIENGLDLKLELSRQDMTPGDQVDLKLIVSNVSDEPLTLHFSSGQIFDFYAVFGVNNNATGDKDSLIWNWAHDKVFTESVWDFVLEAGETQYYQVTWDGRDNSGNLVSGELTMGAELVSVPGGRPEETILNIKN